MPPSPTGETDPTRLAGLYREDAISGTFTRLSIGDTFTQQDILDGLIEYRQNGQEANALTLDDRVLLSVEDSVGNTPGPIDIQIDLTDIPDAPVVQQSGPWTVGENAELPITSDQTISPSNGLLLVTDDDLSDTPDALRFTIVSDNQSAGLFRLDAGSTALDPYTALTVGDTFTQQDVDDGLIVYRQNGQEQVSAGLPDRLELTVVDSTGKQSASPLLIDIDVIPENDLPEITLGAASVSEGGTLSIDSSVLSVSDNDGTPIESMTLEFINPTHGSIEIDGGVNRAVSGAEFLSGSVRYIHDGLETGSGLVLVRVTDPSGGFAEVQLSITVDLINDLPSVDTNSLMVQEMSVTQIFPTNLSAIDEESDNGSLRYVLDMTSLNQGVIQDLSGTVRTEFTQQELADGQIFYVHSGAESAPENLLFSVHDSDGGITPASLDILISPTNDVPELVGMIDQQVSQEGQPFSLTFDQALWSDNDIDDVLELNVVQAGTLALPDWLTFDKNTRTLSGTPQNADVGVVTLSVTAVDQAGAESSPLVFDLEVLNTNSAPEDLSLLGQNVEENVAGAAVGLVSANDLDVGDVLTYSVNDSRFEIVSGELVLKPEIVLDHEVEASIDLTITVTDSVGEITNLDVTIDVDDSNDLPVLQSAPVIPLLQQNVPVQIPVDTFVDQDQFDNITYSATLADGSELPDWIEFTDQRELIIQSNAPAIEEIGIILIAEDSSGGRAVLPLSLAIEPAPAAAEPATVLIDIPDIEPVAEILPVVVSPEPVTVIEESDSDDTTASEATSVPPADNDESNVAQIEQIDLQALIPPLETRDEFRQVEVLETEFQILSSNIGTVDIVDDFNVVDLSGLLDPNAQSFSRNFQGLVDALDNQRESFSEELNFRQKVIGSTATLTSGFSVGYVIWLIRGGTLMGSMLSALPAWRFVDPLPILGALDDDDNGDDDSLEALVDSEDVDGATESSQNEHANQNDGDEQADQSKAA